MLKIQMETRNIVLTLEDETKFLIEIANQFGKEAQNILDFVAKTGNLEKAAKVLRKSEDTDRQPTSEITDSNEKHPDGVYFISDNHANYQLMTDDNTTPSFPVKYIGVKLGQRTIAVALKDLPGDNDGKIRLFTRDHTSPEISTHCSYNNEANDYRFNAFEDFDGQANTNRLKEYGCTIDIPDDEWIPSMGELALLMMHAGKVNKAIELAGGEPIKHWHWSSTEHSQNYVWGVNFSDVIPSYNSKFYSEAIRTVTSF